jgi:hypothetical protein
LNCQYKTAFVLAHKLREVMEAEQRKVKFSGVCEVDGAYFGGTIRPQNEEINRVDRRLAEEQTGKRRSVVVIRERKGSTLTRVFNREAEAVPHIRERIPFGATVHADEARGWDALHAFYDMRRVNHSLNYMGANGENTNQAESFFSRLRRSEIGQHHVISNRYLSRYASEMAWREDNRRRSNGSQFKAVADLALHHPISADWCGYWQRGANEKRARA